jgi:adenylate cyclase
MKLPWPARPSAPPGPPGPPGVETVAARLLREVDQAAQRRAGLVRMVVAALIFVTLEFAIEGVPPTETVILRQVEAARLLLGIFALTGLALYALARRGIGLDVLPYATATLDAALIFGNLIYNHATLGLEGNFLFAFPVIWVVPIALAGNAIYYRPGLQIFSTALYVVGLPLLALAMGTLPPGPERAETLAQLQYAFGGPPNWVRGAMILAAGIVLIFAARQGRRLLDRAVRETGLRLSLTRYLPRELAPILTDDGFEALRQGRRIRAALLFVDIRGSTALAASLEPARLARFVTAYRRRIMRAAAAHEGVIDKFIGDGALILFGVPAPRGDEPARALACARTITALIERWNAKRGFDPPIVVGLGLHCGEVFCGVVGSEDRLEFTVLGEPVSVAARLEQANKRHGTTVLASQDIVAAAGEGERWVEVARERLPGMPQPIGLMTPAPPNLDGSRLPSTSSC